MASMCPDLNYRTSTASPTTFPASCDNNTFTNSYRLINDWVVTPKFYVNMTGGFLEVPATTTRR